MDCQNDAKLRVLNLDFIDDMSRVTRLKTQDSELERVEKPDCCTCKFVMD